MTEELATRAYIPVHKESGLPIIKDVILAEPLKGMEHNELVGRKQAEDAIAAARSERDERSADIDVLKAKLASVYGQRDAWKDTANQYGRNEIFYHDLLNEIGKAIGKPAHTNDEGGVYAEPLALVVRDIVVAAYKPQNRLLRAFRMLVKGF